MIPTPSDVRVWLAIGRTDMRRGMNGLALQVQEALQRDPHVGDLFVFRGARGDLIKTLWHDGLGLSLYAKEGVRLHDLRHTFVSIGAGASLGLPIVGKLLGHSQPQTTARYAQLDADPLRRASNIIGSHFSAALADHSTRVKP